MASSIGRLEKVPLRELWKHEEHGFTVWLLENIDALASAVGFQLLDPQREVFMCQTRRMRRILLRVLIRCIRRDLGEELSLVTRSSDGQMLFLANMASILVAAPVCNPVVLY